METKVEVANSIETELKGGEILVEEGEKGGKWETGLLTEMAWEERVLLEVLRLCQILLTLCEGLFGADLLLVECWMLEQHEWNRKQADGWYGHSEDTVVW